MSGVVVQRQGIPKLSVSLTPWTVAVTLLLISFVLLWPTWRALHDFWLESTRYSHGYLVLAISGYLVFRIRADLIELPIRGSIFVLVPLSVVLFVWLVSVLGSIQAIHEIILPILIWTMCLAALGWHAARHLILPVAYLYFAIPIWESINFALQWATVRANEFVLLAFQIPAFIDGNSVHLPAGTFSIDGGCSGLHYLIIAGAVSVLYGALFLKSVSSRILLLSLAIGLALLTNWIRVFTVIYAGHLTDMQHFLVVRDHYYFGWILFIVAMVPFMFIARKIEGHDESLRILGPGNARLPKNRGGENSALAAVLCLGLVIFVSLIANLRLGAAPPGEAQLSLMDQRGAWVISESARHQWAPAFRGADAEALKIYRSERGLVSVYANLYRGQTQGKEAIGHENHVEGNGPWVVESARYRDVDVSAGEAWWVNESVLTSPDGSRRLLFFWYFVNERSLAHPVLTKLYYGFEAITGIPETGVQILSAECMGDCEAGRQLIESWLAVYLPHGPGRLFDTIETVGP